MKEIRETIGVQHDCVVNNDELFALKRVGTDNSVYSRCVEVCSSDVAENQGKGISFKVVSPIVKLNHELPPFFKYTWLFYSEILYFAVPNFFSMHLSMHIAHIIMYCISMLEKQQRHQVPRKALVYQLARQCETAISVKLFFFKWGNNFLVFLRFYLDSECKWHLCSLGSACFVRQMIFTLWQLITLYQLKINLKRNHHESHWE